MMRIYTGRYQIFVNTCERHAKKTRCRRKILVSPALNMGVIYSLKNLWPINENITLKNIRIAHDLFNITKLLRDLETSQQKLQKLMFI